VRFAAYALVGVACWTVSGPAIPAVAMLARAEQMRPSVLSHGRSDRSLELTTGGGAILDDAPEWRASLAQAMRGRHGTAVVLDRDTGRILAVENPQAAMRMAVAPGSTIKPLTLWALLNAGLIHDGDTLACPRELRIGSHDMACSHPALAQTVTLQSAIAYSCNNFVARNAARFKPGQLGEFLRKQGLAQARGASTVEQIELQALGEEAVRATPLELARAYARLSKHAPKSIIEGLQAATQYGTARLANIEGLAGKTGTADGRAWFVGFTPEVVVAVVLPGSSGGADAAPVAKQILAPGGVWVRVGADPVQYLTTEEYVAAALAGECNDFRSDEALKAMAVTIRTCAARFRGRHHKEGFDFCGTTHCQALRLGAVTDRERAAAEATAGELLWHEGKIAAAYYSQNCGGATEAAVNVWPDAAEPYLPGHEDSYCTRNGRLKWSLPVGRSELRDALRRSGLRAPPTIDRVEVTRQSPSGRAVMVMLSGHGESRFVTASSLRFAVGRSLGWNRIRSMFFNVRRDGEQFIFEGYGAGHGVGLCQNGADEMGVTGKNYHEILAFYYPGTAIGQSARGFNWRHLEGERVELMTTEPQRDQHLTQTADSALLQAERLTGMQSRLRPLVRIYPTVSAFRDSTGESGAVAGDERGRVIRLQPNPSAQTMLHEMLHFVLEQNAAANAPRWLREGLVAYLAGDERVPPEVSGDVRKYGRTAMLAWITRGAPPSGL